MKIDELIKNKPLKKMGKLFTEKKEDKVDQEDP